MHCRTCTCIPNVVNVPSAQFIAEQKLKYLLRHCGDCGRVKGSRITPNMCINHANHTVWG